MKTNIGGIVSAAFVSADFTCIVAAAVSGWHTQAHSGIWYAQWATGREHCVNQRHLLHQYAGNSDDSLYCQSS